MQWKVCGSNQAYASDWVEVWLDDVQLPDGGHIQHHVVKFPRPSVGAVVIEDDSTLLIWRHRHITDSWGWEIPAGWADEGEDLAGAAAREIEEETAHRPNAIEPLVAYNALSGISTIRYHLFLATELTNTGATPDGAEAADVKWIPLNEIPRLVRQGLVPDGPSLMGLTYFLGIRLHE